MAPRERINLRISLDVFLFIFMAEVEGIAPPRPFRAALVFEASPLLLWQTSKLVGRGGSAPP